MTRVARTKLGLMLVILLGSGGAMAIIVATGFHPLALLLLFAVLLLPGRIQGRYFRELLQGRLLLSSGQPAAALDHFQRFLLLLRTEPWRKRLFWLSFSVYTPNAEAMTLNNIGAAHLGFGNLAEAESALGEALALDPLYPLPYFNCAVLAMIRGEKAEAVKLLNDSARLGYSGGSIDTLIQRAQSVLAQIEGRGASKV